MRVLIALVALCLVPVPVAAQQQEEPATLKMDGSPALADPGTPVTLKLLNSYPEEYVGNRTIENVRIREMSRIRSERNESESIYNFELTDMATGATTVPFSYARVPFVTADERLGRYLIENALTVRGLRARLLFRFELFSFESFRHKRIDEEKPFYCANVYAVELRDKDGKMVATIP